MDEDAPPPDGPDPATDYPLLASLYEFEIWRGLLASHILEAAAIRHCLAGDMLNQAQGSDVVVCRTLVVVADEQVDEAGALLSSTGTFLDAVCTYFRASRTDEYFPGRVFVTKGTDPQEGSDRVNVIPASYLHLDLGAEHYARNTVLVAEPRCRLPNQLHYIDALISVVVERTLDEQAWNGRITSYLRYQMFDFVLCTPPSLRSRLPPEDLLFLELFHKIVMRSAKRKLCAQWTLIRRGETTVEEARTRIPRKDLEVAAIKAKYEARRKQEEAAGEGRKGGGGEEASVL